MNLFDFAANNDVQISDKIQEGLRLHKLEVYNWGTFDKAAWVFAPKGETALLTGDVGSGKSTLIDALTTLFVSPRKAAYNKAADASAKERTTTSYVRGYYGQKRTYEGKGKPEALRETNQYSVLLATFKDELLSATVSMAQFFWFKDQQATPSRFYVVSDEELFVTKNFSKFSSDVKILKAGLKQNGAMVFDDYNHYAECYRKKLGGLKEQAINLFQQTISMKKVEALTDFVRSNMLEEPNTDENIQKLLSHYHDLNSAYNAVIDAREKIEMLTPIYNNGTKYVLEKEKLLQSENAYKGFETWFARQTTVLYQEKIAELEKQQQIAGQQVEIETEKLASLDSTIDTIKDNIRKNGGEMLERLKADLRDKKAELARRESTFNKYKENAEKIDFPIPDSLAVFNHNSNKIPALTLQIEQERTQAQDDLSTALSEIKRIENEIGAVNEEITSLRSRKSNIPSRLITLRNKLCIALNIGQEELPFVGELIEVKESESAWEGAIERLLQSFALSLLVSEKHYAQVVQWVNREHLGAKLVYFNVNVSKKQYKTKHMHPFAVAQKLNIKSDSPFYAWIEQQIANRFDYICCDEISIFQREEKAITKAGQIKSHTRHEKDDRRNIFDRTNYILGFSNEKKIKAWLVKAEDLQEEKQFYADEYDSAEKSRKGANDKIRAVTALSEISSFLMLDIYGTSVEIENCEKQMKEIRESNNVLNELNRQLERYKEKRTTQDDLVTKTKIQQHDIDIALKAQQKAQLENQSLLETEAPSLAASSYPYLEENKTQVFKNDILTLVNMRAIEKRYITFLQNKIKQHQGDAANYEKDIEKGMDGFKYRYQNETKEVDATIASLSEYNQMLEQLQNDDLPKYEHHFKDSLHNNVLRHIALFQGNLKHVYNEIKTRIDDINHSLYSIDYNPGRFIRLEYEDSMDREIREFKSQLKSCTEGVAGDFDDEDVIENVFLQIKEIIRRFEGRNGETESDARWTKKVTDVRNWLIFSASERWRENDEEYEHYTDSGGKSGGQKEKLAYTILAASLVYNFGLNKNYDDKSSFRFVAIDEAFLKSSDDSARFGLQLFQKLKLQLLVVTPLLKIPTIEPFISHVGFVSHDDRTHQSSLMNITIDEFKRKRQEREEN